MAKFSLEEMNEMYMDVLKEIGNIGAGNAMTAISSMLSMKVDMKVPKVEWLEVSKLGGAICPEDETVVGIFLELSGDISGSMMFMMRMPPAQYLVSKLMMREEVDYNREFDEMDLSALKEVGNIIAGSYLSALSKMTNLVIAPSIPYIAIDMAASILSIPAIEFGQFGERALLIETEFMHELQMDGHFILMPEQDSYPKILKALGVEI